MLQRFADCLRRHGSPPRLELLNYQIVRASQREQNKSFNPKRSRLAGDVHTRVLLSEQATFLRAGRRSMPRSARVLGAMNNRDLPPEKVLFGNTRAMQEIRGKIEKFA